MEKNKYKLSITKEILYKIKNWYKKHKKILKKE